MVPTDSRAEVVETVGEPLTSVLTDLTPKGRFLQPVILTYKTRVLNAVKLCNLTRIEPTIMIRKDF